jgi:hypothetical protein
MQQVAGHPYLDEATSRTCLLVEVQPAASRVDEVGEDATAGGWRVSAEQQLWMSA